MKSSVPIPFLAWYNAEYLLKHFKPFQLCRLWPFLCLATWDITVDILHVKHAKLKIHCISPLVCKQTQTCICAKLLLLQLLSKQNTLSSTDRKWWDVDVNNHVGNKKRLAVQDVPLMLPGCPLSLAQIKETNKLSNKLMHTAENMCVNCWSLGSEGSIEGSEQAW